MDDIGELVDSAFSDEVQELKTPFNVYKLDCKNIIQNNDAFKLRKALLKMPFKKKSCDLYSFCQSPDFYKIKNNQKPPELQQFLSILKVIKQKISSYLGRQFRSDISVSCSKYDRGDYLLCHDDRVDDRSVAFIYYLNYNWLDEWGGTLDIYSVDANNNAKKIVKSISPEFNTMIFFPVGDKSYHQVAENNSNLSRISINGWFHSDELNWRSVPNSLVKFTGPLYLPLSISDSRTKTLEISITSMFHDPLFRETIKDTFLKNGGYILCDDFFKSDMLELLSNEIYSNDLRWKTKGPLNIKYHKYLELKDLPFKLLFLVNMLKTDFMFKFVKDCTGYDTVGVSIEVQRWHGGHYMVSGGNDTLSHFDTINLYIFFCKCCGEMTDVNDDLHYVFEEKHKTEPVFACKPVDNSFFMVHKNPNLDSYVKYCKKMDGHSWTVIVANYVIKGNFTLTMVKSTI